MAIIDNLNDEITLGLRKLRGEAPSGRMFLMDGTRVEDGKLAEPWPNIIEALVGAFLFEKRTALRQAQMDEGLKLARSWPLFGPNGVEHRVDLYRCVRCGASHDQIMDNAVDMCGAPRADVQTGFVAAYGLASNQNLQMRNAPGPETDLTPGMLHAVPRELGAVIRQFHAEAKAQADLDFALQVAAAAFPSGG